MEEVFLAKTSGYGGGSILVPGKKYPETGIRFLYDKPPAII